MTIEKPTPIPKLKGRLLLKPYLIAQAMDMRLLGPGVAAVTII